MVHKSWRTVHQQDKRKGRLVWPPLSLILLGWRSGFTVDVVKLDYPQSGLGVEARGVGEAGAIYAEFD